MVFTGEAQKSRYFDKKHNILQKIPKIPNKSRKIPKIPRFPRDPCGDPLWRSFAQRWAQGLGMEG